VNQRIKPPARPSWTYCAGACCTTAATYCRCPCTQAQTLVSPDGHATQYCRIYTPLYVPADPLLHARLLTVRISSHKALPGLKAVLGLDPRPANDSHYEKKQKYPHGQWHAPPAHWAVLLDHQQYTPAPQDSRCGRAMSARARGSGSAQRGARIDRWCCTRLLLPRTAFKRSRLHMLHALASAARSPGARCGQRRASLRGFGDGGARNALVNGAVVVQVLFAEAGVANGVTLLVRVFYLVKLLR
jgi:hypothetical protein